MKSLILGLVALTAVANAQTSVECRAVVVTAAGTQASVPMSVFSNINDAALAGSSIKYESYSLVVKSSDETLKNKELFVRMDARNKGIQIVGDLKLKAEKTVKGTRILVGFEDRMTQQSNNYTMTAGSELKFSIQNRSSQSLKISCSYGYSQFTGI